MSVCGPRWTRRDPDLTGKRERCLSAHDAGRSTHELAQEHGVHPQTMRRWIAEARRSRALRREYTEMLQQQAAGFVELDESTS